MNYFDHNKYNVLVTGANGHIGESISKGFAMMGANVFLNGRDKKKNLYIIKKI